MGKRSTDLKNLWKRGRNDGIWKFRNINGSKYNIIFLQGAFIKDILS